MAYPSGFPYRDLSEPSSRRVLNFQDALAYLDLIKYEFRDTPEVYNNFLDIMKGFKDQILDAHETIEQVESLFRGYPNLIRGFNVFLAEEYTVESDLSVQESDAGATSSSNVDMDVGADASHPLDSTDDTPHNT